MASRIVLAWLGAALLPLGLTASCSSRETPIPPSVGVGGAGGGEESYGGKPSWQVDTGSGGCNAVLYEPPVLKSPHVETCSPVEYLSNPPTSGPHYPKWANFQSYSSPVPWGFLVHAMEHGGVILAHRCESCSEIDDIQAWVDAQPAEDGCFAGVKNRLIVVPAPDLEVPFAMAAWGAMLEADCFDPDVAEAFVKAYYAGGPEDICSPGFDPTDPAEMIPEDCGQ